MDYTDVMSDQELEKALEELAQYNDTESTHTLAVLMNENQMITIEEFNQILADTGDEPIKSSLPQQTRPSEPDNDTNVDNSIQRLMQNDAKLTKVNLNNMKRTPIPQIKRIIMAMKDNEYVEALSLANMGLYDNDVEPLIDVLEENESLRVLNLETNYLSGEFFARLFQAALKNQTLEEIKAVNQGVSFSTTSEKEIIKAIFQNRGLLKVSVNFRLPEGRHKVDQATSRNQEIRRILRRQAAQEARMEEEKRKAEEKPKPEPKAQPKPSPVVIKTAPSILKTAGARELPKASAPTNEQPKTEPQVPKWRRPKPVDEPTAETSQPSSNTSSLKTASDNKPSTSNGDKPPAIIGDLSTTTPEKKKTLVKKSSSSEAVDGVESQRPKLRKKKKAIPPVILADPVVSNGVNEVNEVNGVESASKADKSDKSDKNKEDSTKPPKPVNSLTATPSLTHTSDSEPTTASLKVPQDEKLLTTTTTNTSATSESDVPSTSEKPKKKLVRKKRIVKPESVTAPAENGKVDIPTESNQSATTTTTPQVDKLPIPNTEEVLPPKPKKKIIRKKKVVKKENEEPKAINGVEPKTDDSSVLTKSKLSGDEVEPKKVFSRSRLYSAAKDS